MNIKNILICFMVVVVIGLSDGQAQTDITPKTIRIKLTVNSPSPTVRNKIYNAFMTEIRKTPDLQLVNERYVFGMEIITRDITTSTGVSLGYVLSTVTSSVIACQEMFQASDGKLNVKYQVDSHAITLTDSTRLQSDIKGIVAALNKRIDPMRKVKVTISK